MNDDSQLRIGLIGSGQVCRVGHGPAIVADGRARIAALCDPDDENRTRFTKMFKVPGVYRDHQDMLEREKLDAVVIASPHWLHARHIQDSITAGLPILCEKPMCTTLADCRAIVNVARNSGVYLQICHNKRFEYGFQRIKELIAAQALGQVFQMSINWHCYVPDYERGWMKKGLNLIKKIGIDPEKTYGAWRIKDDRTGGGDFFDHGPHYIDLIRFLLGDIKSIFCETRQCYQNRVADDLAVAIITLTDNTVVVMERSLIVMGNFFGTEIGYIYGEKGKIRFDVPPPHKQKRVKVGIYKMPNMLFNRYVPAVLPYLRKKTGYFRQMKYFVDQLTHQNTMPRKFNGPWAATPEDANAAIAWTLAGYKSAREGIKVYRKDIDNDI